MLLLTAAAGIRDRVEGLGLGADDYLTKPFAFAELVARVQALVPALARRRCRRCSSRTASCWTWPGTRASRDGRLLALTPKEFAVLHVLMRAGGQVVSAEELLEQAWDEYADPFTNAVRVTVMTLRRKLGDPPVIHTVPARRLPASGTACTCRARRMLLVGLLACWPVAAAAVADWCRCCGARWPVTWGAATLRRCRCPADLVAAPPASGGVRAAPDPLLLGGR